MMSEKLKFMEAKTLTHDASSLVMPKGKSLQDPSEVLWDVVTFGHDEDGNICIAKYEPGIPLTHGER